MFSFFRWWWWWVRFSLSYDFSPAQHSGGPHPPANNYLPKKKNEEKKTISHFCFIIPMEGVDDEREFSSLSYIVGVIILSVFFIIWVEKIPRRNCWLVVVVAPIEMIGVGSRPHTNFYFDLPADDLLGFWCDFSLYTSCRKWNSWWQSHDFFSFFFFLFSFESWYRNISFQLFWIGFIMNSKKWTKQIWIIGQSIRECDFGSFRRPYRQRGIKLTSTNSWVYY